MKKFLTILLILFTAISIIRYINHQKLDIPQIGKAWVDNIIDAREKIAEANSTNNTQLLEANENFLKKSIRCYHDTLKNASKKERKEIEEYLEFQAEKHFTTPDNLLTYNINGG